MEGAWHLGMMACIYCCAHLVEFSTVAGVSVFSKCEHGEKRSLHMLLLCLDHLCAASEFLVTCVPSCETWALLVLQISVPASVISVDDSTSLLCSSHLGLDYKGKAAQPVGIPQHEFINKDIDSWTWTCASMSCVESTHLLCPSQAAYPSL